MKRVKNTLLALIVPVLVVAFWWYVTNFTDTPSTILPKISAVGARIRLMLESGQLQEDLKVSLLRVLEGYVVSAILGILLGTIIGMSELAKKILQPTLTTIRQIPIMAMDSIADSLVWDR